MDRGVVWYGGVGPTEREKKTFWKCYLDMIILYTGTNAFACVTMYGGRKSFWDSFLDTKQEMRK